MFYITMNLKRKFQFKNRGVRRLAVSAANPNNPLPMRSYGLLGFTKTFTPTYLLLGLLLGVLVSGAAQAQCPPGSYLVSNPSNTYCLPDPGYRPPQQAPQQPVEQWERRWGAIATSVPDGVLGVSTDRRSEREASQAATGDCAAKGGLNCKIEIAYDNQCAAVIVGNGGYNAPIARTVDQAVAIGMKTCRDAGRTNCHAYYSACSLPVRIR